MITQISHPCGRLLTLSIPWIGSNIKHERSLSYINENCLVFNNATPNSHTSRSILRIPWADCETRWKKGDHNGRHEFLCHGYSDSESLDYSLARWLDRSYCDLSPSNALVLKLTPQKMLKEKWKILIYIFQIKN